MAENAPPPPPRRSPLRSLLTFALIAGLGAMAFYLASERNARRWYLVAEGGRLTVKKGIFFPAGRGSLKTGDAQIGQAYAPLDPPPGATLPPEQDFDDRASLDQALYGLLSAWAHADIAGDRPEALARGLGFVARAERLPGLSAEQREDLAALRAESGFYEARRLLDAVAGELRAARDQLKLAAGSPGPRSAEATGLLKRVEPLVEEAYDLARAARAAGTGSAPPPPEAPDGGAGAPAR